MNTVSFNNRSALIVDDHPINLLFAKKLLSNMQFQQIDSAASGQEALKLCAERLYDVVLMDCQMPEMDGFEATAHIRQNPLSLNRATPIIAVTADAMLGVKEKCIEAGMNDYLTKPMSPAQIAEKLRQHLSEECSNVTAISSSHTSSAANDSLAVVDLEHLHLFTGGDKKEEQEIVDLFFATAADSIEQLQQALLSNMSENWRKAAHKLKGAAANFGAPKLAACCLRAESAASTNSDSEMKQKMFYEILTEIEAVRNFLKKAA